jgi:hypothetical protein
MTLKRGIMGECIQTHFCHRPHDQHRRWEVTTPATCFMKSKEVLAPNADVAIDRCGTIWAIGRSKTQVTLQYYDKWTDPSAPKWNSIGWTVHLSFLF